LMNHPDYQDKSNGRNRRRRRRSDGPGIRSGRSSASPPKLVNNGGSSAVSTVSSGPILDADSVRDESVSDTSSLRGKRSRGRGRKPEVPPKVVTVALTPDEQRIYAEMGVSPLVLSQQGLKDTKNVVVSVVLPGEEPLAVEPDKLGSNAGNEISDNVASEDGNGLAEVVDSSVVVAGTGADSLPEVGVDEQVEPVEEVADMVSASPNTRRRRRRRSSATSV
ncbi:MAG: ribonuclease E/G, partial [Cyanobacteria bacterium P01_D01_bin.56]